MNEFFDARYQDDLNNLGKDFKEKEVIRRYLTCVMETLVYKINKSYKSSIIIM